jgi:hypothetical protein
MRKRCHFFAAAPRESQSGDQHPSAFPNPLSCPPSTPVATACVDQLHPFHGFQATNNGGQVCLVTYSYRAAQAMALVALSSKTPFDPCTIDLPSMAALAGFYHTCLGFPV